MNALVRINILRKLAKAAKVEGYNTMKLAELEALGLEIADVEPPTDDDDTVDDSADTSPEGEEKQVDATREAWLMSAVDALRPMLMQAGAVVPLSIAISVGFAGGRSASKTLGQCWATVASECGQINHIFVSPLVNKEDEVLAIILHELIHASDNCASGHKGHFRRVMKIVELEGKPTATYAGDALKLRFKEIVDELGYYPHKRLNLSQATKPKQSARMLKLECNGTELDEEGNKACGAIVRTTRKNLDKHGNVWPCPCGSKLVAESDDDPDDE